MCISLSPFRAVRFSYPHYRKPKNPSKEPTKICQDFEKNSLKNTADASKKFRSQEYHLQPNEFLNCQFAALGFWDPTSSSDSRGMAGDSWKNRGAKRFPKCDFGCPERRKNEVALLHGLWRLVNEYNLFLLAMNTSFKKIQKMHEPSGQNQWKHRLDHPRFFGGDILDVGFWCLCVSAELMGLENSIWPQEDSTVHSCTQILNLGWTIRDVHKTIGHEENLRWPPCHAFTLPVDESVAANCQNDETSSTREIWILKRTHG